MLRCFFVKLSLLLPVRQIPRIADPKCDVRRFLSNILVYIKYIIYLYADILKYKFMATVFDKTKRVFRRKNIDISENTFRILSIQAITQGTNLKRYIENLLDQQAADMEDAHMYAYLSKTDSDGKKMVSREEQDDFEKWLGL